MTHTTYADALRPTERAQALLYDIALVLVGTFLVALCAQLAIRIPFNPVPITGQTFGVLVVGSMLGSRRAAISLGVYLLEGFLGLPVFAGGAFGPAQLLGPTGGYLLGFVLAAYLVGLCAEHGWDRRVWTTLVMMSAGTFAIYILGLGWLSGFVGWKNVLAVGLYPFILGDIAKAALAAFLLPAGWRLRRQRTKTGCL